MVKIPKWGTGSRAYVACPVCAKKKARVTTITTPGGKRKRKLVCYNPECRAER